MATVYRKTDKGRHEIETRANRLLPRLRSALIVVDGQRSDEVLRGMVAGDFDATVDTLLAGGYIEVVSVSDPRGQTRPASATAPGPGPEAGAPGLAGSRPATPAPPPPVAPAASGPPVDLTRALADRKRLAVRFLTDRLGPAAEGSALRIESARSPLDLGAALDKAEALLRQIAGTAAARAFREQFIETPLG